MFESRKYLPTDNNYDKYKEFLISLTFTICQNATFRQNSVLHSPLIEELIFKFFAGGFTYGRTILTECPPNSLICWFLLFYFKLALIGYKYIN